MYREGPPREGRRGCERKECERGGRPEVLNGGLLNGEEAGGTGCRASLVGRDVDDIQVPVYKCGEEVGIMNASCCCG